MTHICLSLRLQHTGVYTYHPSIISILSVALKGKHNQTMHPPNKQLQPLHIFTGGGSRKSSSSIFDFSTTKAHHISKFKTISGWWYTYPSEKI